MGTANDCPALEIAAYLHLSQHSLFTDEQPNGRVFFGDLFHLAEGKKILAGGILGCWHSVGICLQLLAFNGDLHSGGAQSPRWRFAMQKSAQEMAHMGMWLFVRLFSRDKDMQGGSLRGGTCSAGNSSAKSHFPTTTPFSEQKREKPDGAILCWVLCAGDGLQAQTGHADPPSPACKWTTP